MRAKEKGGGGGEKDEGVRWTATDEARDATDVPNTRHREHVGATRGTDAGGGVISLSRAPSIG